jgi:membrane-bound serine protease (ClpP class)
MRTRLAALRWALLLLCLLAPLPAAIPARAQAGDGPVIVLRVRSAINPISARYLDREIGAAEARGARAVVIELDTPGGLVSSTREITQRLLASRLPVIVYVSPPGARAASAGVFITLAGSVAAMAPSTNIGSAHPVGLGGEEADEVAMDKAVNDAVAGVRNLAVHHGRNADWAEKAVRESVNITAREAVELRVVDLVAGDLDSLLREVDGRRVRTGTGEVVLRTAGAAVERRDASGLEDFLQAISDPNIALLLLSLAGLAIFLELSNPGAILPGVVGVVAGLLALFALGMLPTNYAALGLIFAAFVMFILEIKVVSHGLLTVGGVLALALGGALLVDPSQGYGTVSPAVLGAVTLGTAAIFAFIVGKALRAQRRTVVAGVETLVGALGLVKTPIDPVGQVLVEGERWEAWTDGSPIPAGERVRVLAVDGLRVKVERPTR